MSTFLHLFRNNKPCPACKRSAELSLFAPCGRKIHSMEKCSTLREKFLLYGKALHLVGEKVTPWENYSTLWKTCTHKSNLFSLQGRFRPGPRFCGFENAACFQTIIPPWNSHKIVVSRSLLRLPYRRNSFPSHSVANLLSLWKNRSSDPQQAVLNFSDPSV